MQKEHLRKTRREGRREKKEKGRKEKNKGRREEEIKACKIAIVFGIRKIFFSATKNNHKSHNIN